MDNNQRQPSLDFILRNWPIIIFLISLVYTWGHFEAQFSELTDKVSGYQEQAAAITATQADEAGNIKEINAKLDIILKKIQL